jgi:hypothetical protein
MVDSSIGGFIKSSWTDPVPTAPILEFPSIPNPAEFYIQHKLNESKIKDLEEENRKIKSNHESVIETNKRIKIAAIVAAAIIVAIG